MINHLKEVWPNLVISGGFAAVCGGLSYLLKVEEGKPFKFSEMLLHTLISGVCGLVSYIALHHLAGFDPDVCGAFSGIAGWMGTRLLRVIELRVRKKIEGV
ncbi:phage holin family protein [Turicimonas muris]|uniref:phage holin family protein n=1 Tax=Turicimonas muris TaxID=1796652 RepID=UPI002493EBD4|nr:phage holin family protein [Turicimonas muris]